MNPLQPLVVACGVGVDSIAALCGLAERGIRPDAVLFADVGSEKPETMAYIPLLRAWLQRVGFPDLTIVKYVPKTAPYETLTDKCLTNHTLPSLAYGGHSCAIVFKHDPQDKWTAQWPLAKRAWAKGLKVTKVIGYDNGDRDCARRAKADRVVAKQIEDGAPDLYDYWYPLQEWGWDRMACIEAIERAGLPVPMKSACFFCPASKKAEIIWLRDTHPDLFATALEIEWRAIDSPRAIEREALRKAKKLAAGEKYTPPTTVGLGRTFRWSDLAHAKIEDVVEEKRELMQA
jgi:hypothetical protein